MTSKKERLLRAKRAANIISALMWRKHQDRQKFTPGKK